MVKSLFHLGGKKPAQAAHSKPSIALTPQQKNERNNAHLEGRREEIRRAVKKHVNDELSDVRTLYGKIAALGQASHEFAAIELNFAETAALAGAIADHATETTLDDPTPSVIQEKCTDMLTRMQELAQELQSPAIAHAPYAALPEFALIQQTTTEVMHTLQTLAGVSMATQPAATTTVTDTATPPRAAEEPANIGTRILQARSAQTSHAGTPSLLIQAALPTTTLSALETQATAMAKESPTEARIQLLQQLSALHGSACIVGKLATQSASQTSEPLAKEAGMILNQLQRLLQDGVIATADSSITIPQEDIRLLLSSPSTQLALQDLSGCQAVSKKALFISRETSQTSARTP